MTSETADLPEFVFDGASFDDLAGFFTAITRTLRVSGWGRNLDAFNDILRGGFGTPDGGFILRWTNSERSAERLGWPETIRFIEKKLTTCHPANIASVQADLAAAHRQEGQTLFEIILSIIGDHGPEGAECVDNVHLILALARTSLVHGFVHDTRLDVFRRRTRRTSDMDGPKPLTKVSEARTVQLPKLTVRVSAVPDHSRRRPSARKLVWCAPELPSVFEETTPGLQQKR